MNNKTDMMNESIKKRILHGAFECISSKGYANVSLRNIADEAGVVLSQLNYYYKNKEGLFTEVIKMTMKECLLGLEDHLKKGINTKEKVVALIKCFQEVFEENPKSFILLYDFTSMALWSEKYRSLLCNLFEEICEIIEKYVLSNTPAPSKSNLCNYSSESISRMIFGAMFGIAIQVILDPQEKKLPRALNAIELVFK